MGGFCSGWGDLEGLLGGDGDYGAWSDLCGVTVLGERCVGEGHQDGGSGCGRDGAGGCFDAEDAADGEVGGGEFGGVDVMGEGGGSEAAEFGDLVVEVREFDAEEV